MKDSLTNHGLLLNVFTCLINPREFIEIKFKDLRKTYSPDTKIDWVNSQYGINK